MKVKFLLHFTVIVTHLTGCLSVKGPVKNVNVSSEPSCHIDRNYLCEYKDGRKDGDSSVKSSVEEKEKWKGSSVFEKAAVSVDARECASIGSSIMKEKGGNCIDSVISVLFCMGLVIPESMGLGGGFLMTFYNATSKKAFTIDARDVAPAYAHDGMFKETEQINARIGIHSIAIPGELAGYWRAHQLFGSLQWRQLIEPTLCLAREGFKVGNHLADSIRVKLDEIYNLGTSGHHLLKMLINPLTERPYREGEIMKREDLAATLQVIADQGVNSMYSRNGTILKKLMADLRALNSTFEDDDFINYKVKVHESPEYSLVNRYKIYSPSAPGSGEIVAFIVDVMLRMYENVDFRVPKNAQEVKLFWSRLIEVWKFAFAQRSFLGDPAFEKDEASEKSRQRLTSDTFRQQVALKILQMTHTFDGDEYYKFDTSSAGDIVISEDHGTAAVTVIDSEGNAVAVGTTINQYYGSYVLSPSTGIVLNDGMDDFASAFPNQFNLPPSKFNRIAAGKRPMSSMAPSIVMAPMNKLFMAIGGSGGTQITTSTSLIILKCILFGEDLTSAIESRRLHHQLQPNVVKFEESIDEALLHYLTKLNHTTQQISGRSSIIMALKRSLDSNQIQACSDSRKGGAVDGW